MKHWAVMAALSALGASILSLFLLAMVLPGPRWLFQAEASHEGGVADLLALDMDAFGDQANTVPNPADGVANTINTALDLCGTGEAGASCSGSDGTADTESTTVGSVQECIAVTHPATFLVDVVVHGYPWPGGVKDSLTAYAVKITADQTGFLDVVGSADGTFPGFPLFAPTLISADPQRGPYTQFSSDVPTKDIGLGYESIVLDGTVVNDSDENLDGEENSDGFLWRLMLSTKAAGPQLLTLTMSTGTFFLHDIDGSGISITTVQDGRVAIGDVNGDTQVNGDDCAAEADSDDDGVDDTSDNCPDTPNPGQEDNDSDGLGNVCDPCPDNPDCDNDGWNDFREDYIGTDLTDPCPDNSSHDAWHVDINRDKKVDVVDVFGIDGWKQAIAVEADMLDPLYDRRLDLIMDDPNDPSQPGNAPPTPQDPDGSLRRADIDSTDWLGIMGFKDLNNKTCGNGSVTIDSDGDTTPELVVAEDFYPGTPAGGAGSWYDETYSLNPDWRVQMTASQADLSTISYRVTCPDADEHNFSIKWTSGAPPVELDTGGSHTVDCNDGSKVTVTIDATHQDVYSGP